VASETGDQSLFEWPEAVESVVIHGCALGPIHPTRPDWDRDAASTSRDLSWLRQLLQVYSRVPVHVVFSSSVLALGPGGERGYYAGWKCLIEATIAETAAQHGRARVSVLYPGRLVESRSLRRPASLLHSTYAHIARVMIASGSSSRPRRTLVGLDARLWLLLQGLRSAARALASRLSD
jgi:hypothetical protein